MTSNLLTARNSPWRLLLVPALLVAAAAHLPVIRPHLSEAPYMGVLFVVLTAACVLLAATVISWDSRLVYLLSVLTCGLALVGYVATRLVAFPMLSDDVGNWLEPLGVVSIVSEWVAVAAAALAASSGGRARRQVDPSAGPRPMIGASLALSSNPSPATAANHY